MVGASALISTLLLVGLLGTPTPISAQQVIFLMRHPEQSADPEPILTEAGHRRAAALAHRLKDAGIGAIYVTDAVRTRETAEPIAKQLGIVPKVGGRQDIEGLVARIRAEHPGDRVLVVNHALNIAPLLKALGHPAELRVALDDYEPLLVIVPRADGPPLVIFLRL
jgi:broad specificity phosphatase PhoE